MVRERPKRATNLRAYYNENDPFAAAWLRELIKAELIAGGEVDERSIEDVQPEDVRGFTQCHFFAGIGVWSYALRNAGWADDLAVWTGSCPCQGFSASGQRGGFSDKRHLWPAWFRLVRECRPDICFGEQVASQDGLAWLDVVSADLEGEGYAVGATDLCAAGFGAPHIRQRLYFVADSRLQRQKKRQVKPVGVEQLCQTSSMAESGSKQNDSASAGGLHAYAGSNSAIDKLGYANNARSQRQSEVIGTSGGELSLGATSPAGRMANARNTERGPSAVRPSDDNAEKSGRHKSAGSTRERGLTSGFWRDAEWIYCRDEKWRPVEPGTFPLATGTPARVGRLRGYGNALNAEVAKGFIEAYMSTQRSVFRNNLVTEAQSGV